MDSQTVTTLALTAGIALSFTIAMSVLAARSMRRDFRQEYQCTNPGCLSWDTFERKITEINRRAGFRWGMGFVRKSGRTTIFVMCNTCNTERVPATDLLREQIVDRPPRPIRIGSAVKVV